MNCVCVYGCKPPPLVIQESEASVKAARVSQENGELLFFDAGPMRYHTSRAAIRPLQQAVNSGNILGQLRITLGMTAFRVGRVSKFTKDGVASHPD